MEVLAEISPDQAVALREAVDYKRAVSREFNSVLAGQLVETLRRARNIPMGSFPGDPEPMAMLVEAAGALSEGFRALDVGRSATEKTGKATIAEGLSGRHGELALELAQWSGHLWEIAGGEAAPAWPRPIEWGSEPDDLRVKGPVGLVLTASFLVSAAMSLRLGLHDGEALGITHPDWSELSGLVVRLLSWSQEMGSGSVMLIEDLVEAHTGGEGVDDGGDPAPALQSAQAAVAGAQTFLAGEVSSPLSSVDAEAKNGLQILVERCQQHEQVVTEAIRA
jgi:hypothetical protein